MCEDGLHIDSEMKYLEYGAYKNWTQLALYEVNIAIACYTNLSKILIMFAHVNAVYCWDHPL